MSLKQEFLKTKPDISIRSLKTYVSCIKSIGTSIGHKISSADDAYKYRVEIIDFIKDLGTNARNNRQTALSALLGTDEKYNEFKNELLKMMMDNASDREAMQGIKSEKEEERWIPWTEILDKYKALETSIKPYFKKDKVLNNADFKKCQLYVLLSCLILIPVRRALDYTAFKIRNGDDEHNYLDRNEIVFNKFKTFKFFGQQKYKIPPKLRNIINTWKSINTKSDYLLVGLSREKPIVQSQLNHILNDYLGDGISVSIMRKIFSTWYAKQNPTAEDIKNVAWKMAHSVRQQKAEYLKV